MASPANSDDEEDLALALRLSQLSSDDFDEQIAQLPPEGSASANHTSRSRTPTGDGDDKDDLALLLRLSQLSSDDFDEQVPRLYRLESAPVIEKARLSTSRNQRDEDDLELALNLHQLPADVYDEQVNKLSGRGESRTAVEDRLASLLMAMSLVEVWTTPSFLCDKPLTGALGRYARRIGWPVGLGFGRRLWISPA
jgi:hypothetical protein